MQLLFLFSDRSKKYTNTNAIETIAILMFAPFGKGATMIYERSNSRDTFTNVLFRNGHNKNPCQFEHGLKREYYFV